jgi:protease-4
MRSFTEVPLGEDLLFASGGESFYEMTKRLNRVCDDDKVVAVVVLGNSTGLGTAQMEEVRRILDDIREADKEIYVHAESLTTASYTLYSGATRISVVPQGDLFLTGLRGQSLHVRGLLDMIGVEPDYLTCGDYKSAGEMFTHKEPSPEAADNLNWLLDGMFESFVRLIGEGRGVEQDQARQWIDRGLYSASEAKQSGIIDAVEFRDDFVKHLKEEYGDDIKFDRKYGKKKQADIDFSTPFGILKFYADLLGGTSSTTSKKDAIAIVYVEGPILAGASDPNSFPFGSQGIAYSTPIRRALDKVANDEKVKGVVLRVNSPGGSAVGSEVILEATRRVKGKKPFAVSMGDVAGSGGYYVACAADNIFVETSTITASIGVVAGKLVTRDMWNKIGVHWHSFERGENAGLLGSSERFTDSQREVLQSWMDEIYEVFQGHVTAIRGDRLKKDLNELAGGRVFTGQQALDLGLVDQIGGLNDAIEFVAKEANLEDYEVRVVPRPKSFADLLRESLTGEEDVDQMLALPRAGLSGSANASIWQQALPYLDRLDPGRRAQIETAIRQLQTLQEEQAVLAMPGFDIGDR